ARIKEIVIEEYLAMKDKKMAKQSMDSSLEKLWYFVDEDDEEKTYVFDMNEFPRLSSMEDDLFAYELGVLEDYYFPCVEQPYDDLDNGVLDIYEHDSAMMK
ncbi:hypothetical protein Tco_1331597, partial [Tanacetum coccineum]